jgi:hypothetical protein
MKEKLIGRFTVVTSGNRGGWRRRGVLPKMRSRSEDHLPPPPTRLSTDGPCVEQTQFPLELYRPKVLDFSASLRFDRMPALSREPVRRLHRPRDAASNAGGPHPARCAGPLLAIVQVPGAAHRADDVKRPAR